MNWKVVIGIGLALLAVSVASLHYLPHKPLSYSGDLETDADTFRTLQATYVPGELERIAHEHGALYAFDILRAISATTTPTTVHDLRLHTMGHVVGNVLYEQQGLQGIVHCTPEFSYSCYHAVLSAEVLARGETDIADILAECKTIFDEEGSCEHGMGHGFVAISNYDIHEALQKCEETFGIKEVNSCAMGAYMEFNMHTMAEPGGTNYRSLDENGMYYPCTEARDEITNECYYFIPKWWFAQLGENNFKAVGELCDAITSEENKDWCYIRLGLTIRELPNTTVEEMVQLCLEMPSLYGQTRCMQKLNEQYWADSVCDVLPENQRSACRAPVQSM